MSQDLMSPDLHDAPRTLPLGAGWSLEDLWALAHRRARLHFGDDARAAVEAAHDYVARLDPESHERAAKLTNGMVRCPDCGYSCCATCHTALNVVQVSSVASRATPCIM